MKKLLIRKIFGMLVDTFTLSELDQIKVLLVTGSLSNLLELALDKAIKFKTDENWQQENQIGV